MKHYKLLAWKDNYTNNQAFYYFLVLIIIDIGLSLIYIYFEKYHYINMQNLRKLKSEITKINIPYRDDYAFNNELKLVEEIKGKLKYKRKPNMEEMNLDTNNINIEIMADEIGKYNKGFKKKENAIGFTPVYFGIKGNESIKTRNSRFFPDENDISEIKTNYIDDKEISQKKLKKMNNFFQDSNHNKKQKSLSGDKKLILFQNQKDLSKINETIEDDDFTKDLKGNIFFKKGENEEMNRINNRKIKNIKKMENRISNYKNFEYSEALDSESQLKSSKRESSTKRFFNPNPPKKENNVTTTSNPFILTEKDQKKIGKSNSRFFNNDNSDLVIKNKRKERNIFQKDYDNLYKPNFEGPKFVSQNLGFFNNDNATIDFEQNKEPQNKDKIYFGSRLKTGESNEEFKEKKENAEIKKGFYYKNKQIDFFENEEEMPELAENLTFLQKMEEFHGYDISFKKFLIKNIVSRHILLTTFDRMSIVYQKYMRAGNFIAQLSMFAFFLAIFFTKDEKQIAFESKEKSQFINLFLYCLFSDILGCIVAHLPAYFFWVNDKKFRKLYNTISLDEGINVFKLTEEIIKKNRFFWNITGIIIQIIYIFIGFYFSFGFCATYSYQSSTFCFALICTCGFDFLVAEFLMEIIIGFLFYIKNFSKLVVFFGTLFNTLRNIKHLVA